MRVHKFDYRQGNQYIRCTGKKCDKKESGVSYFWKNVKCPKCIKTKVK